MQLLVVKGFIFGEISYHIYTIIAEIECNSLRVAAVYLLESIDNFLTKVFITNIVKNNLKYIALKLIIF